MEPWFEKEKTEGEVIKFPSPKAKVIQMPNVQSYPTFLDGVKDLQNRKTQGEISQASYDKLYADLIHRFMQKESFETPWFLREYQSLDQAKQEIIQKVQQLDITDQETGEESAKLLDKIYSILNKSNTVNRLQAVVDQALADEYKEADLVEISKTIAGAPISYQDKLTFIENLQNDKCINHKMLITPGNHSLDDLCFGSSQNFAVFSHLLEYGRGKQRKGPGEHALAIMSKSISVAGMGDINVAGTPVELKVGMSKGSGRFGEEGRTRQEMISILTGIPELANTIENYVTTVRKSINVETFTTLVNSLNLDPKKKKEIGQKVFGTIFGNFANDVVNAFAQPNADPGEVLRQYVKSNFNWYKGTDQGGKWEVLCSMAIAKRKFVVISDGEQAINGTVSLLKNTPYVVPVQPTDMLFQPNPR